MGIRVTCPNGHVLNVKSHLAGKKGRCPNCEAVFEIPSSAAEEELDADAPRTAFDQIDIEQLTRESAQLASRPVSPVRQHTGEGRGNLSNEGSVSVAVVDEPKEPLRQTAGPPADITSDPSAVWYVRRASGEQYGPAQGMMFWQWVQEGRVPEDSHVWKQGWPEWKSAKEWLARKEQTPQRAAQPAASMERAPGRSAASPVTNTPAARPAPSIAPVMPEPRPLPASISPTASAATRTARRRKNSDMTAAIIIVLLLLFLASLTGAIVVVYQSMQ